jgi:hypothetical protein
MTPKQVGRFIREFRKSYTKSPQARASHSLHLSINCIRH